MKDNLFKIFLFTLFGTSISGLKAQNVYIWKIDETQQSYSLNDIKKMTFSSGNLIVNNNSVEDNSYALNEVRYLNFTDLTLGVSQPNQLVNQLMVYPNPAKDVLNILIPNQAQLVSFIEIISIDGRVLQKHNLNTNNKLLQMSLYKFPQGIYFCKWSNNLTTQIVKFIKQ